MIGWLSPAMQNIKITDAPRNLEKMKKFLGIALLIAFLAGCVFLAFFEIATPLGVKMCAPIIPGGLPPHRDCWQDNIFLILSYVVFGGGTFFIYVMIPRRIAGMIGETGWRGNMELVIKRAIIWLVAFIITCGISHFFDITTTLYGGWWFYGAAISKFFMFIASAGALFYFDRNLSDYIQGLPSQKTYINLRFELSQHEKERAEILIEIDELKRVIRDREIKAMETEIREKLTKISDRLELDI